jgi:inorganic pyrophosphatase
VLRKLLIVGIVFFYTSQTQAESSNPTAGSQFIVGDRNFLSGYAAIVSEHTINVVIEIPAGTGQKWEVSTDGSSIHWELRGDTPRVIEYLPYPANYGMIPRTTLPKYSGGDGDPLDVVLLSSALPRGSIVEATPIGVLRLVDQGETDDKILAVPLTGPLSSVNNLELLERNFPAILESLKLWFTNYKGGRRIESGGVDDESAAWQLIRYAAFAYDNNSQAHFGRRR